MLDVTEHASLVVGVFHLLHLDDLNLLEHLDSIESRVVFRLDQVYSTETTGAKSS